jgi:autotransporter-associated beta strand protein/T5SS/PEP-CTERM-associated repeat protein
MAIGYRSGPRSLPLAYVAGLLMVVAAPAYAATTTYTGVYAGGTIAPGNTVLLNNGATVTGNIVDNGTLQFNQTGALTISNTLSGTGSLLLTNTGTLNLTGTSSAANTVVLDMTTNVSSGGLQTISGSAELRVGNTGVGVLNITGGRVFNYVGRLGYGAGSAGSATISSGTWSNMYDLRVGESGIGVLNVNGGKVTNTGAWIGTNAGGSGTATISSGTWESSYDLNVGFDGKGTLNVAGGSFTNPLSYFGRNAGSTGSATLSGGTWNNTSDLNIGFGGVGTLSLSGGVLNVNIDQTGAGVFIGKYSGATGTAIVSSGTWTTTGGITVGDYGSGRLTINGGRVTSAWTSIGSNVASSGVVTVTGGTWTSGFNLGDHGTGVLNVSGGYVLSDNPSIGWSVEGNGAATITGGTLATTSEFNVGASGTGSLTIGGSGVVSVAGTLRRFSKGTINLSPGGTLQIGTGGTTGVLGVSSLTNNGTLVFNRSDASTYSGVLSGTGTLVKLGAGTLNLTNTSAAPNTVVLDLTTNVSSGDLQASSGGAELRVGNTSGGVLNVNGGRVSDAVGWLGYNSGVSGSATVSSGTWSNTYDLKVGESGIGVLNVNGGKVTNTYGWLGRNAGSLGTATVSSGTWENSNDLNVANGTLNVTGGSVTNYHGNLGYYANTSGSATVSSGTWANSGNLTVGTSGTGTLTMSGGLVTVGGTLSRGAYGTINLSAGGTLQIGTGGTTGVLAANLTNNGTLVFNRADASTYSGSIGGAGRLAKEGAGTLVLTGTSTYTAGTRLSGGILRAENDKSLGSGQIMITGSAVRLVLGEGVTLRNDIVIDQPINEVGNGAIQYEGSGVAVVSSGTIFVVNKPVTGGVFGTRNGGTLRIESPIVASGTQLVSLRDGIAVFCGGGEYSRFWVYQGNAKLGRTDGLSRSAVVSIGKSFASALDLAGYDQTVIGIASGSAAAAIGNSSTTRNSTLTVTGTSTFAGVIQDSLGTGNRQMCLAVDGGWLGLTGANTMTGSTTVKNGTLQLGHLNALPFSSVSVLSGGTLSLAPGLATTVGGLSRVGSGVVDVGNGLLTVADGLSVFNLYAGLSVGRGSGVWDGVSGMRSSSAAASNGSRTVGWLDNGDGSVTFGYAAAGDTNLDWTVDIIDIANFLSSRKFNSGLTATWAEGDFNYDGFVDITDIADFLATGLYDAGSYNKPAGTIAAVPEPNVLGLIGVGAGVVGLMAMRRKRAA